MTQSGDGAINEVNAQDIGLVLQGRDIVVHGGIHQEQRRRKPTPRQTPPPVLYFINRSTSLARLDQAWKRAKAAGVPLVVACTGPGGIGKSELAAKWLHTISAEIPGPHLYADMGEAGPKTAADVLRGFLRAMGEEPEDIPEDTGELSGLFRTLTSERPVIVFLDDVALAAQVRPFIPNSPGSVVLITARVLPDNLRNALEIEVGPMADKDALGLLDGIMDDRPSRTDRNEIGEVVRLCRGTPLTLWAAASQLGNGRPAREVARQVEAELRRSAGGGESGEYVVEAMFNAGYDTLSESAAALYRRLGALFGRVFTAEMAAAVGASDALPLVREMVRAGLVEELRDERFRLHDLALHHARGKATQAELDAAGYTLIGWYLRRAAEADHALLPGRWRLGPMYDSLIGAPPVLDEDAARNWLEDNRGELRAAVKTAADRQWHDLVVRLAEAQWALCFKLKYYEQWIDVNRSAVASAPYATDPRFIGRVHVQLGFGHAELGRLDEAADEFATALESDREIGHVRGEATAIESLGLLMLRRSGAEELPDLRTTEPGFAEQARLYFVRNLELNSDASVADRRAEALAWRHLGRALSATGHHDEAIAHLQRAKEIFVTDTDTYNLGKTLTDLAQALFRAGRRIEAKQPLTRARSLLPPEDSPAERVTLLETLSVVEPGEAVTYLSEAAAILETRHHPRSAAIRERLAELTNGR